MSERARERLERCRLNENEWTNFGSFVDGATTAFCVDSEPNSAHRAHRIQTRERACAHTHSHCTDINLIVAKLKCTRFIRKARVHQLSRQFIHRPQSPNRVKWTHFYYFTNFTSSIIISILIFSTLIVYKSICKRKNVSSHGVPCALRKTTELDQCQCKSITWTRTRKKSIFRMFRFTFKVLAWPSLWQYYDDKPLVELIAVLRHHCHSARTANAMCDDARCMCVLCVHCERHKHRPPTTKLKFLRVNDWMRESKRSRRWREQWMRAPIPSAALWR